MAVSSRAVVGQLPKLLERFHVPVLGGVPMLNWTVEHVYVNCCLSKHTMACEMFRITLR